MSSGLMSRLERMNLLGDLPERVERAFTERAEQLRQQAQRRRRHLVHRGELAAGQAKESALKALSARSITALDSTASALKWAPQVALVRRGVERLDAAIEKIEEFNTALEKPSIKDYDELNVHQVNAALEELDAYELNKIKRYEMANKDRVTIQREIERLLD